MRVALALLPIFLALPASAQSATDPVETVKALYAADNINDWRFHARSLRALFEKDREEANGEMGRLGFAYHVNGQDIQDGWERTLVLKVVSQDADKAEVQARFKNFEPQDIRYDLAFEDGRWRVADVRSLTKERWRLTEILSAPF